MSMSEFSSALRAAKEAHKSNNDEVYKAKCSELEKLISSKSYSVQFWTADSDDKDTSALDKAYYRSVRQEYERDLDDMTYEYQSVRKLRDPDWDGSFGTKRAQLKPQQSTLDRPFWTMLCSSICS